MPVNCEQTLSGAVPKTAPGVFARAAGLLLVVLFLAYLAVFVMILVRWPIPMGAAVTGCLVVLGWCLYRAPIMPESHQ